MKNRINTGVLALTIVIALLAYTFTTTGGNLNPSGGPSPTMHTLDEIFEGIDSLTGLGLTKTEKAKIQSLFIGQNPGPFLRLQIDGNDIEGESTIISLDRENTIECFGFEYDLVTPRDQATGTISGKRQHSPVTVLKPVDKSSPLLYRALCQNEPVNSAEFRFYRPSQVTPGTDEHYYTVLLENGYIESITAVGRGMEKVAFVFQDITWTYEIGGVTHKDSWRGE